MSLHPQQLVHSASLRDPEGFWSHQAEQLHWHKKPSRVISRQSKTVPSGANHDHWTWFPDGEISTTYNCVDRHVENGNGDNIAIIWESPVTGTKEKYTYRRLLDEVEVLAGVLREEGVRKGDVVIIYCKAGIGAILPLYQRDGSLTNSSAYDSCGAHCCFGDRALRCYTCGCLRRICGQVTCAAHRSSQATHHYDSVMWYRRTERPYRLSATSRGSY